MTTQHVEYVRGFEDPFGKTMIEHLDGVPWHQAPKPRRWHRCWPQTRGWMNYFTTVDRCACGAVRLDDSPPWINRNSRS